MVSATLVCGQNKTVSSFSQLPLDKKCAYFIEISNEERATQLAVVEKELQKIDKDDLNKKNRIHPILLTNTLKIKQKKSQSFDWDYLFYPLLRASLTSFIISSDLDFSAKSETEKPLLSFALKSAPFFKR